MTIAQVYKIDTRPEKIPQKTTGFIDSSYIFAKRGKGSTFCHYYIKYHFEVDRRIYYSDEITFSHTGEKQRSFAEGYVKKYPPGVAVTVYYEKNNPFFSVIEPNEKDPSLWFDLAALQQVRVPQSVGQ